MTVNFRTLSGIILTIIVIVISLLLFGYVVLLRSLPPLSGELSSGNISQNVNIFTDKKGIVYIEGDNDEDAIRGLGFVHARDRLFQMEMMRRVASGRLSEVAGSKTVPIDVLFKTIGLTRIVERDFDKLEQSTKNYLNAYAEGVNLIIDNYGVRFTPELNLFPGDLERWTAEDSYLISKFMGWMLNLSWWTDAPYVDLARKFGIEKVNEIIPQFEENYPAIISQLKLPEATPVMDMVSTDKIVREYLGFEGTQLGSNNWVISPVKAKGGEAMLANDPHLAVTFPGLWYGVVLSSPEYQAGGVSIPGAPGIVIGSNGAVAWGYTNVMADDCDFYAETIDSTGNKYLLDGVWTPFEIIQDTIFVKDSADVALDIKINHRGPVINNIRPNRLMYQEPGDSGVVTMRWTGNEFSDEIGTIHKMNKALDKNTFVEAVEGFKLPGQNFLFADSAGNIGYICAARLPIRKDNNPTYIFDGSNSENDWKGFVPYDEMPKVINPSDNFVASANNKVVKSFRYHISNIWEPTSRIERIREYLTQDKLFGIDDFRKLQMDIKSVYAAKIVPVILDAFKDVEVKDNNLRITLSLLGQWNFEMDKGSQTPAIFSVFKMKLLENLFLDEMGSTYFKEYVFLTNIPHRILEEYLSGRESSWIDNVTTDKVEKIDDIIRESLVDAVAYLEENYGNSPEGWQWGKLHKLKFTHPFSQGAEFLSGILDIGEFEISGDGTTLHNTEFSFVKPYDVKVIASTRVVYDFNEPGVINLSLPTGQSGHFKSDYYDNLTARWLNGEYLKVSLDKKIFANNNYELFVLKSGM